jgi:hypothetical protein
LFYFAFLPALLAVYCTYFFPKKKPAPLINPAPKFFKLSSNPIASELSPKKLAYIFPEKNPTSASNSTPVITYSLIYQPPPPTQLQSSPIL